MYTNFAYLYDKLTYDINYKQWADYIEEIFKLNGVKPSLVLDLGCGTGNLCMEMAARGYEMIGIDLSPDMLSCAKEKSEKAGLDILYLNQDMADFELYGTVDVILCLLDSLNYILYKNDVKRLFKLVRNYLNPGGLFIFDINSQYKLEKILGNNIFYDINDEITYLWKNHFDKKRGICEFDLTFFVKGENGYDRYDETHFERAYTVDALKSMVRDSGLKLLNIYHNLDFSRYTKKSERIFFVAKK